MLRINVFGEDVGASPRKSYEQVLEQWHDIIPHVRGRLQQSISIDMTSHTCKGEVLLPALAALAKTELQHILAIGCITIANCAQFERDMKSIKELWRKRSKKNAAQKLGAQARLSLHHGDRLIRDKTVFQSMVTEVEKQWEMDEHREPQKRKARCDKNVPRKKQRVDMLPHLTQRDVERMEGNMVDVGAQIIGIEDEPEEPTDLIYDSILDE